MLAYSMGAKTKLSDETENLVSRQDKVTPARWMKSKQRAAQAVFAKEKDAKKVWQKA
eukprot:CAMPEP_0203910228 /NCGR_PEP_ID=MMETSP0359-20131031/51473_1 /ASSEMBLY_ACC=CAM_ASM_000338 /TAXON_ID=268821 /ORGANISM="Scrippsiella Hangoei, Strain SHTV-5" /LENGTH=56 /DNA_ID=CAMNT_0050835653 /DNA_START=25 /DNA_END=191 /DNA_ORIENTATION=-